jgi:hypothetical protein
VRHKTMARSQIERFVVDINRGLGLSMYFDALLVAALFDELEDFEEGHPIRFFFSWLAQPPYISVVHLLFAHQK